MERGDVNSPRLHRGRRGTATHRDNAQDQPESTTTSGSTDAVPQRGGPRLAGTLPLFERLLTLAEARSFLWSIEILKVMRHDGGTNLAKGEQYGESASPGFNI